MISSNQVRLWRVEWVHINGYQAPYQMYECKKRREAVQWAKKSSRLADFPNVWSFRLIEIIREKD
jgi:hypothetical protein